MLDHERVNLLAITEGVIAHGCNTAGVMNAGVAKGVRSTWPTVYEEYLHACRQLHPDDLLGMCQFCEVSPTLTIANCFTQRTYGRTGVHADLSAIEQSVRLAAVYAKECDRTLYMPQIGCGYGGLSWKVVEPIISHIARDNGVHIRVCTL